MPRPAPPHMDCATTSLLTQELDAPPSSCLPRALRAAREELDEIVFLGTAEGGALPGHVVLRDVRSATVREPGGAGTTMSAEDYAAANGQRVLCAVPPGAVRGVLALPVPERPAALARLGGPLPAIAHLAFGGIVEGVSSPSWSNLPEAKHTQDWLKSLDGAVSDADKEALAQPIRDAGLVKSWITKFKRDDDRIDGEMPEDVKQARERLKANDATDKLVTDDKGDVTRDTLSAFMKKMEGTAEEAGKSFAAFKKDTPDADPVATQQAVDASILQANLPILDVATKDGKKDDKFTLDDLKAVTGSGDTLSDPLKNAAGFYSNKGQLGPLDIAGGGINREEDGVVSLENLDSMVETGMGENEDETISKLKSSAITQAIANEGGKSDNVGADYFKGGETKASAADKAAAMMQLGESLGNYEAGYKKWKPKDVVPLVGTEKKDAHDPAYSPERAAFRQSMTEKMDKLAQDPEVQAFISEKVPAATQAMVNSDPKLKETLQKQYEEATSSKGLEAAFKEKGKDGDTNGALGAFAQKASFYEEALGKTPENSADLTKALEGAPQEIKDRVKTGYEDIVSGAATQRLVGEGKSPEAAQAMTAMNKTLYDVVLDKDTVLEGTDRYNEGVAKNGRDDLMKDKTPQEAADAMFKGLGVSGADDPALEKLVTENMDTLVPGNDPKNPPRPNDVVTATRAINDLVRSGLKYDAAVETVKNDPKYEKMFGGNVTEAYRTGVMHGASGLLLGGLALSSIGKVPMSDAQITGHALQAGTLLADGGIKYHNKTLDSLKEQIAVQDNIISNTEEMMRNSGADLTKNLNESRHGSLDDPKAEKAKLEAKLDKLTTINKSLDAVSASVGGVAGGALGVVTGAISLQDALKKGDKLGAGMAGTTAVLSGLGTLSAAVEVGAFVAPRLISAVSAGTAAAVGGVAGAVGGAIGGVAAVATLAFTIIQGERDHQKMLKEQDKWNENLQKDLVPLGVEVPKNDKLLDSDGTAEALHGS